MLDDQQLLVRLPCYVATYDIMLKPAPLDRQTVTSLINRIDKLEAILHEMRAATVYNVVHPVTPVPDVQADRSCCHVTTGSQTETLEVETPTVMLCTNELQARQTVSATQLPVMTTSLLEKPAVMHSTPSTAAKQSTC